MSIKILLADDHQIMREGLYNLLKKQPNFEVLDQAEDGITAVKKAKELEPDVIIMDIGMPGLNGIEATRQIKSDSPFIKVIALSMYSETVSDTEILFYL